MTLIYFLCISSDATAVSGAKAGIGARGVWDAIPFEVLCCLEDIASRVPHLLSATFCSVMELCQVSVEVLGAPRAVPPSYSLPTFPCTRSWPLTGCAVTMVAVGLVPGGSPGAKDFLWPGDCSQHGPALKWLQSISQEAPKSPEKQRGPRGS